jgi:hypothetical protein
MTSELDPKARELIGMALQGERRLPRNRERVRRGVLAAVAAPLALTATEGALAATKAASTKAFVATALWLKVAPVVVLATAAGVAGYGQLSAPAPVEPARVAARPAAASMPASSATLPEIAPRPEVAPVEPAPLEPAPVAAARPKLKLAVRDVTESAPSSPSVEPPPSLSSELEALQRAQRALNGGDATRALTELGAVSGRALQAERTALEVFALCKLGSVAAARQKAALFRQLAPGSPLLPRVQASCAGE